MTRDGKSCRNGRTSIGPEVHLCIFSSLLPKKHEGSPLESRWYVGTWNHLEGHRELGGRPWEPTLRDRSAALCLGEICLVRFFVFWGFRRPSLDLQSWILGEQRNAGTLLSGLKVSFMWPCYWSKALRAKPWIQTQMFLQRNGALRNGVTLPESAGPWYRSRHLGGMLSASLDYQRVRGVSKERPSPPPIISHPHS